MNTNYIRKELNRYHETILKLKLLKEELIRFKEEKVDLVWDDNAAAEINSKYLNDFYGESDKLFPEFKKQLDKLLSIADNSDKAINSIKEANKMSGSVEEKRTGSHIHLKKSNSNYLLVDKKINSGERESNKIKRMQKELEKEKTKLKE